MPDAAPLTVTAELPGDLQQWADGLRRAHFPPERNFLAAHVTLFHAIPPMYRDELRGLLAQLSGEWAPVAARLEGVMSLGRGTALRLSSPAMLELRALIADHFHGVLSTQDRATPRLHVTVQNKVSPAEAKALQLALQPQVKQREFAFPGLALFAYRGGPWEPIRRWQFRGMFGG
ncbi:MAG: 2'-5' RNA ligase family protein [Betaproteobacteria bacterium]|nr:2'-5' RNA ligase family protein [Betaproteobacteria bacterium]